MLIGPLLLSLVLADAGQAPVAGGTTLHVPFLPQTEALCGGAAAAMLFRYWGERHADVQQFEPLVDRRAGGIAEDVLERAIRERSWTTQRLDGSLAALRAHLAAGQPLMLLIEDRPQRYHYVVLVGADDRAVYVHDPAWGPSRRLGVEQLDRAWKATGYWTLLVLPDRARQAARPDAAPKTRALHTATTAVAGPTSECDRLIDAALDDIAARGLDAAGDILGQARTRCPQSSRPLAELAGVRFSQRRTSEAVAFAEQAVQLNPADAYAWDVLGSGRFVANDLHGALAAWNHVNKPQLDSVHIEGLRHTRYALVARALQLTPNALLTEKDYRFAERRLHQLPDRLSARIGYRPEPDGFATVDIVVVERPVRPTGLVQWAAAGAQTLIDRELTATVPGRTGQGEVWSASWRWWDDRPRGAFAFAAPRVGRLPGVWRVDGSWEAQTYSIDGRATRETRSRAGIGIADWITANLRYQLAVGLEAWNGSTRAASIGAALERRLFGDRVSVTGSSAHWTTLSGGSHVRRGAIGARFRSSEQATGFVAIGGAGLEHVSAAAPLALWPGAGDGRARGGLLRAHPLLEDNVVAGPVFGRRIHSLNIEGQRWFEGPALLRFGAAAFVDAAGASDRLPGAVGRARQVDAGVGLRVRLPGRDGTLRIDYARGLVDRADAVTVGWQAQ
ncbi:MAG: hypothetical protein GEU82_12195 [Luteitalea sp.]|nr:hypothetical protein [Luteitalea sp.]